MMRLRIGDDELPVIQERAFRVLNNNNASGSARALARDALRLSTVMMANRRGRSKYARSKAERERQAEILAFMESQFD